MSKTRFYQSPACGTGTYFFPTAGNTLVYSTLEMGDLEPECLESLQLKMFAIPSYTGFSYQCAIYKCVPSEALFLLYVSIARSPEAPRIRLKGVCMQSSEVSAVKADRTSYETSHLTVANVSENEEYPILDHVNVRITKERWSLIKDPYMLQLFSTFLTPHF